MKSEYNSTQEPSKQESQNSNNKELSFEQKIQKLQEIINNLENNEISLSESLTTFKTANKLIKACEKELQTTQLQIETLIQDTKSTPSKHF